MARVRTIDGQWHNVKESAIEINHHIRECENVGSSMIHLTVGIEFTSYKGEAPLVKTRFEKAVFIKNNIILYY